VARRELNGINSADDKRRPIDAGKPALAYSGRRFEKG
jgi:hypothetical protein